MSDSILPNGKTAGMDHRKLDVTVKIGREGSVPYGRAIYLTAMSETEPAGSPSPEPPFVTDPTSGSKRKMTPDELAEWRLGGKGSRRGVGQREHRAVPCPGAEHREHLAGGSFVFIGREAFCAIHPRRKPRPRRQSALRLLLRRPGLLDRSACSPNLLRCREVERPQARRYVGVLSIWLPFHAPEYRVASAERTAPPADPPSTRGSSEAPWPGRTAGTTASRCSADRRRPGTAAVHGRAPRNPGPAAASGNKRSAGPPSTAQAGASAAPCTDCGATAPCDGSCESRD